MKRRFLKIAVLLVLGTIVNVAVAVILSMDRNRAVVEIPTLISDPQQADPVIRPLVEAWIERSAMDVYSIQASAPGIRRCWYIPTSVGIAFGIDTRQQKYTSVDLQESWHAETIEGRIPAGLVQVASMQCIFAGWPLLSTRGLVYTDFPNQTATYAPLDVQTGFVTKLTSSSGSPTYAPLYPVWPGFAINTIFYAAILWLLFAAPGKIRRWRRIKRRLCPACAYPVGESDFCTECGGKLDPHP